MASVASLVPEQDIAARVSELTSQDSPFMRAARTQGLQAANRRGVLNSSMGIGAAQAAAIGAATPIASQEAAETNAAKLARAQITASDRQSALQGKVTAGSDYNNVVSNIMANTKMTAAARNAALASAKANYQSTLDSIEQLYGVNVPAWNGTPAPALTVPTAPPIMGIGGGGVR